MPKKKKPAKTRTTIRQRRLVSGILNGKPQSKAARDAGYAESTARHADKIIRKPSMQSLFKDLLEKAGITDELLATRLREGLDAQETKFFQKGGVVMDSRDVIAFSERRAHVELVAKLKGLIVDKHELDVGPTLAEMLDESYGK